MQAISPDQPASDAAARQKLLDDLAEQARSGGQKEQAEFEAELKAWKNASMVAHANPYD